MSNTIDLSDLKKAKVTIPVTLIIVLAIAGYKAFFGVLEWHSVSFMSTAQGADIAQQLNGHLLDYKMDGVLRRIESTEDKLSDLTLWESANGANDFTRDRKRELSRRLSALSSYRDCIVNGGSNCDSLNPK